MAAASTSRSTVTALVCGAGTTTGSGDSGTEDGVTVGVTDSGGTATGTVTAAIYGD